MKKSNQNSNDEQRKRRKKEGDKLCQDTNLYNADNDRRLHF